MGVDRGDMVNLLNTQKPEAIRFGLLRLRLLILDGDFTRMPIAAPKPCRHAGRSQLVGDGSGYCQAHQSDRKIGKFADERRGSRHERGYGKAWDITRKRILSRDKGLCQPCLQDQRYRPAKQVDHKVPKFEGGGDDDNNLQAICLDCHKRKTAAEALRARRAGG